MIETLCLLKEGRQVRPADLPEDVRSQATTHARPSASPERPGQLVLELADGLESLTCQIIEAALEAAGGSTIRAATKLKVSPRTLQRHVATGRVRVPERVGS